MKKALIFLSILLALFSGKALPLYADQFDYQNFNHGYYPNCDRCGCNPCCCNASEPSAPDQLPPPTPPPSPESCSPCAPQTPCATSVDGTKCGISIYAIGIAIAALCAAAAIIVSSGNGHASHH